MRQNSLFADRAILGCAEIRLIGINMLGCDAAGLGAAVGAQGARSSSGVIYGRPSPDPPHTQQ